MTCEYCWMEASRRALRGDGMTAELYRVVLRENEQADGTCKMADRLAEIEAAAAQSHHHWWDRTYAPRDLGALVRLVRVAQDLRSLVDHEERCATWHSDVYGNGQCDCLIAEFDSALTDFQRGGVDDR